MFHGVPMTQKSVLHLFAGPDYVMLYQKNIEAICSTEAEVREQIRRTVIHEMGHYFGMTEEQLKGCLALHGRNAGATGNPTVTPSSPRHAVSPTR